MVKVQSRVFIDTSAFVSLWINNDINHKKAHKCLKYIKDKNIRQFTSNIVLYETLTVLSQKIGMAKAQRFLDFIEDNMVDYVFIDKGMEITALEIFRSSKSKNLPMFDCLHFVSMDRFGSDTVFGFDKHFKKYGFKLLPDIV